MNYKNIILCFIVLFSSVKSHCNETIVDYFNFNIDKTKILPFFCVAAIVALLYNGIVNYFNNFDYICTYLEFYIFNRDPNVQNKSGWTPLYDLYCYCVGSKQMDLKAIKLLLAHPDFNPNVQNKEGWTPLYICCANKKQMDLEIIKLLLAHLKINLNIQDINGDSPLHIAYRFNNIEGINLLLNHPTIENNINYKKTELHIACINNETTAIKELLTKFHPNIRNKKGNTALHLACAQNNTTIVAQLIDDPRTNLDSKNDAGHTPLIIAANSEKTIEIIPMLIEHKVSYDEHQYLSYQACKTLTMINDIIKPVFGYYIALTIDQLLSNDLKEKNFDSERIRINCIKIVCEKKGYINPYQRTIL